MTSRTSFLALACATLLGCDTDPAMPVVFRTLDLTLGTPSYVFGDGSGVTLVAHVMDSRGMMRPEVPVTITPSPEERAVNVGSSTPQDASFTLEGTGAITFTACITEQPEICDELSLLVDDGRPVLTVDSPTPGEEIDDPDGVIVHGTAIDTSPNLDVFVNGARATIAANGEFEVTLPPRFGVQHIDVLATDALTETARFQMDVLWAGSFTPATDMSGAPLVALDDSVGIWLGQDFFDDGNPLDDSAMPVVTTDVADVVELVVSKASLASLIPNPIINNAQISLSIPNATLGGPHVELSVQDDGIDMFVRASELSLTTTGMLDLAGENFNLAGTITGSAVAYVRLGISKPDATSEVDVTLEDIQIAIESVQGDFTDPDVDAIFTLASSLLRTTIEGFVRDALTGVLETTVPELLETVLSGIDHAVEDIAIDLNQPPLPAVSLGIDGRMSRIDSKYRSYVLAPLSIAVSSSSPNLHGSSRGVARMMVTPALPDFFEAGAVQVGVQLGFLNGVLHVLWSSGLLDLDATPLIPPAVSSLVSGATLGPRMAPVLRPPRENETNDLVLSIGQLELSLMSQGRMRKFGVTLEAGVDITVVDNVVRLTVADEPVITVWENEVQTGTTIVTPMLVKTLLGSVWPQLRDALVSSLAIQLPIPPLPLGGIAPELDGFTLTLSETEARLYPRGELLLLDAAFRGSVP